MPKNHKNQALHNEQFYNHIKNDPFTDWAITGLFYAALHYIDGYLKSKRITVRKHSERTNWLNKVSDLKIIYYQYRRLDDECWNARYNFRKIDKRALTSLYNNEFQVIKNQIGSLY